MLREDSCREGESQSQKLNAEGTEVGGQSSRRVLGGAGVLGPAFRYDSWVDRAHILLLGGRNYS